MFVNKQMLCAALVAASFHAHAQVSANTSADWASVPVLATSSGQSAQTIKAVVGDSALLVLVQGQQLEPNYNLFIDADNNAATGHQASSLWASSGADFHVSNGRLYRSTGAGWDWAELGTVNASADGSAIALNIPLSVLGLTSTTAAAIRLGVQTATANWDARSVLPKASALARLTPDAPAEPVHGGPSFPVGKGFIIPAYLTLDQAYEWNLLKEGAALVQASTNTNFKDFWVAVNSDTSGPFKEQAKWDQAKAYWDPIRAKGGRIFGYIHTVQSSDLSKPESRLYRSLDEVKADVTAWVNGYPDLDGLWIDEFYPRYEIAQAEGTDTPTYPNGQQYAPTDTSYLNAEGKFNWTQVHPGGGYYDQLTRWIRTTYPQLRLIGNAGGNLYSNQYEYGDLVDVLVSFEQNFDTAYVTGEYDPVNKVEINQFQWHGLDIQNKLTKVPGMLALVHGNTGNLERAIDQMLSHGYTHVYTTDRLLDKEHPNVWGGVASYLMTEISYLTAKP